MPNTQQLRDTRANLWENMKEVLDTADAESREPTVEERTKYESMEAALDKLDSDIELVERHNNRADSYNAVDRRGVVAPDGAAKPENDITYDKAFNRYLAGGMGRLTETERDALQAGYSNALSVSSNAAGGYLVPPGYREEFIIQMKEYGAVREVAQVISTDSGNPLQWPTMNDTTNVGRLLAENTQMTETDVVIGTATLSAYVYSSDLTRVSLQLAQDAAFDVGSFIRTAHAERIGRITNQHFTTGTGTNQPQGIVTGATTGVTAASATAITADELIDLQHSVDPAYRRSPRAQYMLSDTALKAVRKLKDANNQYLFQTSTAGDVPSLLAGRPFVVNQDMAVPATTVKSVLFGDFAAGYVIREVLDLQVITFTERYLDFLQVGHSSYLRTDGKTQNSSAYKALAQL